MEAEAGLPKMLCNDPDCMLYLGFCMSLELNHFTPPQMLKVQALLMCIQHSTWIPQSCLVLILSDEQKKQPVHMDSSFHSADTDTAQLNKVLLPHS